MLSREFMNLHGNNATLSRQREMLRFHTLNSQPLRQIIASDLVPQVDLDCVKDWYTGGRQ